MSDQPPINLSNSLTKKLEAFEPVAPGHVAMYHCGPTVYDDVHIGNLRSFVMADTLRRVLAWNGYDVTQVMNITDVGHLVNDDDHGDDKMTKALRREGQPITLEAMLRLATYYQNRFLADLEAMQILRPHHLPRASEHITDDIELINNLAHAGHTYETSTTLYFDTSTDPTYGQLGLSPIEDSQSRTGVDTEKKNPRDFALWKKNPDMGWESPWGKGFPGWHIECSAMSYHFLGDTFDIHTGGVDLAPTHHNNEIAQSTCGTNGTFARYWLHNEHVDIGTDKMSKSLGNSLTLERIREAGYHPLDYRYWLLQSNYRTKISFSWDSLSASQSARAKLQQKAGPRPATLPEKPDELLQPFTSHLNDDLNTAAAIAVLWGLAKDNSLGPDKLSSILWQANQALGILSIDASEAGSAPIPDAVATLMVERAEARASGDWDQADSIRNEITQLGYRLVDGPDGPSAEKI